MEVGIDSASILLSVEITTLAFKSPPTCHFDKFKIVRGDCREKDIVKPLIKKAEIIIPLAALVGMPMCAKEPITAKTVNQDAIEMICCLASDE